MTDSKRESALARRDLFRAAGLGAGALGAGALGAGALGAVAVGLPTSAAQAEEEQTRTRYRETEHIRKAYESSRF